MKLQTCERWKLSPGDHIFSERNFFVDHHGIYVGNDMVVHLMGPKKAYDQSPCQKCGFIPQAGIFKTCLDCFLNGHSLYRYLYGVSEKTQFFRHRGSCSTEVCKTRDQVLETVNRLLEDKSFGSYNFLLNNCEDFAVYCKTGEKKSNQTRGRLFGFNIIGTTAYNAVKKIHGTTPEKQKNEQGTIQQ